MIKGGCKESSEASNEPSRSIAMLIVCLTAAFGWSTIEQQQQRERRRE